MMLRVADISKSFGGNRVLRGISFEMKEGEVLGIIGPNGSGKTTLLNIISGVISPDGGEVFFKGKPISRMRPHKRAKMGIARTFQITRLFSNLSVLENVMIALHYGGGQSSEERALDILNMVGLSQKVKDRAGSLSLAQRKRLELARALALGPYLMLLDEIFAGLNPVSVEEIAGLLKRINEERGTALLLVEHVLKALFRLTRRVIVLSEGRIIYEGDPEGLKKDREVIRAYLGEKYAKQEST